MSTQDIAMEAADRLFGELAHEELAEAYAVFTERFIDRITDEIGVNGSVVLTRQMKRITNT